MSKIKEYEIGKSKLIKDIKPQSNLGKKFCVGCMRWMLNIGGKDITTNDGLRYKWYCKECMREKYGKENS